MLARGISDFSRTIRRRKSGRGFGRGMTTRPPNRRCSIIQERWRAFTPAIGIKAPRDDFRDRVEVALAIEYPSGDIAETSCRTIRKQRYARFTTFVKAVSHFSRDNPARRGINGRDCHENEHSYHYQRALPTSTSVSTTIPVRYSVSLKLIIASDKPWIR